MEPLPKTTNRAVNQRPPQTIDTNNNNTDTDFGIFCDVCAAPIKMPHRPNDPSVVEGFLYVSCKHLICATCKPSAAPSSSAIQMCPHCNVASVQYPKICMAELPQDLADYFLPYSHHIDNIQMETNFHMEQIALQSNQDSLAKTELKRKEIERFNRQTEQFKQSVDVLRRKYRQLHIECDALIAKPTSNPMKVLKYIKAIINIIDKMEETKQNAPSMEKLLLKLNAI